MPESVNARAFKQSRSSTLSEWPSGPVEPARSRGSLRLRAPLYLAFGVLALALLLQAAWWRQQDQINTVQSRVLLLAEQQVAGVHALGHHAARLVAEPAQRAAHGRELAAAVQRMEGLATELETLLARPAGARALLEAGGAQADSAPLPAWLAARRAMLRQVALLQQQMQPPGQPLSLPGPPRAEDEADPAVAWSKRASAVQAEADTALRAARHLSHAWQAQAQRLAQQRHDQWLWGSAGLLALLVLLAAAAVEPRARALSRQARGMAGQSMDVRRLALVAEHTTAVVVITDLKDRIQWVNAAFTRACGWTLEEARGQRPRQLMAHPNEDKSVGSRFKNALLKGEGVRQEWLRKARDGRDLWLDIDLRPVTGEQGELQGFVRVATDVTQRVQQQAKLQALWSALPAGVVVQSETGEILDANRAAESILGMKQAELRGLNSGEPRWRALHEDMSEYPAEQHPSIRTLRTGQSLSNESIGVHTPDGSLRWLLVNTEPQRDTQGKVIGVITCFIDITESRLLQQQLHSLARTDQLTRLPNRAVVMERLQRAIVHAQRNPGYGFALLFMDFDRFKQVNDTLGHSAGDELLRQIALRLQAALRPGDAVARVQAGGTAAAPGAADAASREAAGAEAHSHVAARIGGDEFVVVLDGVDDRGNATSIAERLLCELSEPYVIGSAPVQSGVSIGVVVYGPEQAALELMATEGSTESGALATGEPASAWVDHEGRSIEIQAEELLRNADTAMYEAKRAGRGRWVVFDDSMHERVVRALAVESDLRRAIKADELYVVYQPVVDLVTRTLVGVEALVRWRHPERGLVPPAEFITVAEECGLIDAVGEIVLRKSCLQFVKWQRSLGSAAPRQMSVNLSRAQLKRSALAHDVQVILRETAMPEDRLQLEVTESLAAQDERVIHTLRELKNLGVKLALDDFGTGYSSLACLHLMPVDTVKVDRSFVRHAETVEYHRVLIEATIRVARTLGMTTVAEGIETEGQADLMKQLECDRGQGFLFARPLEVPDLEVWVSGGRSQTLPVMLAAQ